MKCPGGGTLSGSQRPGPLEKLYGPPQRPVHGPSHEHRIGVESTVGRCVLAEMLARPVSEGWVSPLGSAYFRPTAQTDTSRERRARLLRLVSTARAYQETGDNGCARFLARRDRLSRSEAANDGRMTPTTAATPARRASLSRCLEQHSSSQRAPGCMPHPILCGSGTRRDVRGVSMERHDRIPPCGSHRRVLRRNSRSSLEA